MRPIAPIALLAGLLAACGALADRADPAPVRSWAPAEQRSGGLRLIASADSRRIVLHTRGGEVGFLTGVDLGATTPGHAPGELAIPRDTYRRWFRQIGDLGIHVVRIYTIHPPAFYDELVAYNRAHPAAPLYLVQGVYLPDESYLETRDLYAPQVREGFRAELGDAVRAVHGELRRGPTAGRASGTWRADASPWVAGYIIGVELDPAAVLESDARNASRPSWDGRYFGSEPGATPTERWLAEMLDLTASEEAARGRTMPLAFANWPATDPLSHPSEPSPGEDLVGIDANHIAVRPGWGGGYFASYHAYPYFPDFQRHEDALQRFRYRGRSDPYAGYLAALRAHHTMPTVISEFGVPSSFGSSHNAPLGRDQGDHSEQEAMSIDGELLRMIHGLGLGGGFVFSWTDEWFKRSWNTREHQLPGERVPLWHSAWTNEQHFGLVASDPGAGTPTVIGDGSDDWKRNGSQVVFRGPGAVRSVRATHDEAYLYLQVRYASAAARRRAPLTVGLDVVAGGAGGLPGRPGTAAGADYAITFPAAAGARLAQAFVRASNDEYVLVHGRRYGESAPDAGAAWNPQRLILNRPLTVPTTGARLPVETFEIGRLRRGTSDPGRPRFDSRAMWAAAGDSVEMRLPWETVGMSDPSSRQALVVAADGQLSHATVARMGIVVAAGGEVARTTGYAWKAWDVASYHERPKAGLNAVRKAVAAVGRG